MPESMDHKAVVQMQHPVNFQKQEATEAKVERVLNAQPPAHSAWRPVATESRDSRGASARYQDNFPNPRHPPTSASSPSEANWRRRDSQPHHPIASSTVLNDRHDYDERNRDERNRYLTRHPPRTSTRTSDSPLTS